MAKGSLISVGQYPARERGFLVLRIDHATANAHLVRSSAQPALAPVWRTLCGLEILLAEVGTCDASRRLCLRCHYSAEAEITPERTRAEDLRRGAVINSDNQWFELDADPTDRGGYVEVVGRQLSGRTRRLFLTKGRPGYLRRAMLQVP